MADEDDIISVGDAFPRMSGISALEQFHVLVTWASGKQVVIDLGPTICSLKPYAPLREDRALFETVHLANPTTVAWGADDTIDMHVSELERLAGEVMDAMDFKAWLTDLNLTRDAAAALLGMSRRIVNYYASGKEIPRYVALACAHLTASRKPRMVVHGNIPGLTGGMIRTIVADHEGMVFTPKDTLCYPEIAREDLVIIRSSAEEGRLTEVFDPAKGAPRQSKARPSRITKGG